MQQHGVAGGDNTLNLRDRYRAASMYGRAFTLLHLDAVRTAAILEGGHDIEQLEAITDQMKELLLDCAHNSSWIREIVAKHARIFAGWANRVPEFDLFSPQVRDGIKQIMGDPHRLSRLADRVPEEAKAAIRELDEQMRELRTAGRTKADMSQTARCALYGFAAVAAIATGGVLGIVVCFAAGFGAGADDCLK